MSGADIKQIVKDKYGKAALKVVEGGASCCSSASAREADPITSRLYTESETACVPAEAAAASLGCGNPSALAELQVGETVLDLGSGGGIDVLLSARRVGLTGKAYGLDMTDEMLALARDNQRKAGVDNVEFLKGEIEAIPLPDSSVDVVISNCVINLSADKDRVFAEAFRALRRVRRGGARRGASADSPERGALDRVRGGRARGGRVPGQARQGGLRGRRSRAHPDLSRRRRRRFSPPGWRLCRRGRRRRQVHECVRPGAQAASSVSGAIRRPEPSHRPAAETVALRARARVRPRRRDREAMSGLVGRTRMVAGDRRVSRSDLHALRCICANAAVLQRMPEAAALHGSSVLPRSSASSPAR